MLKLISQFLLVSSICFLCACKLDNGNSAVNTKVQPPIVTPNIEPKTATEADQRMAWQKPERVIAALGNIEDKTIADLGAGIGYFSFKLLPKCQKVIAIDIDKDITQILTGFKNTMNEEQQQKFDVRLATPSDSRLQDQEVDVILIVNTITFIGDRVSYLEKLRSHLKENGQVFIVDFKSKRLPEYVEAPDYVDRVYVHKLEDELEAAGYSNITVNDTTLDFQFMVSATL